MSKSFGILYGTKGCWSECKPLPLLVLAGTGAAIGIGLAITSSGLWETTVNLVEQYRKQPVLEGAFDDKQEDRISLLPDELISDIISRLDLIEAVRTRILSRRWKNIIQFRYKLRFDCSMFGSRILTGRWNKISQHMSKLRFGRSSLGSIQHYDKRSRPHKLRFIEAVDQCLQLFWGQSISYFSLKCCLGEEFASNFNRWMQFIAASGVQELKVNFCSPTCLNEFGEWISTEFHLFPFELLFEAVSLKQLQLFYCTLQPSFKGQFKSLQFLTLSVVPLDRGEFTNILSSCVNLQWITVAHCQLPPKLCISGPCLQLWFVLIRSCSGVEEIEIRHGGLEKFHCFTKRLIRYSLPFAPKLKRFISSVDARGTVPYFFHEVAKDCARLTFLLFQTKSDALPYIPVKANAFSNLQRLFLLTMFDTKADLLDVRPILAACPLLEYFQLLVRGPVDSEPKGVWCSAGHHAHLKHMELMGFRGTGNEIELASYMVRSASALESLGLITSSKLLTPELSWTEDKIGVIKFKERQAITEGLQRLAISRKARVYVQ